MSKRTELLENLRDLSPPDLDGHLRAQRRKLFEVRFQQATGQVDNHRLIRELRREIARVLTVRIEAERAPLGVDHKGADEDE